MGGGWITAFLNLLGMVGRRSDAGGVCATAGGRPRASAIAGGAPRASAAAGGAPRVSARAGGESC